MKISRQAFSLVELLVAFALLAIIVALIVPRYSQLQYNTNLRIAEQQADAVRKGVLSWSSAQTSLSDASNAYGSNTAMSDTAWTDMVSNYLDPSFAARLTTSGSGTISYFTTTEMLNTTGAIAPEAQKYGNTATLITQPDPKTNGKYTAYGVIFWPNTATRRNSPPAVVLFTPKP